MQPTHPRRRTAAAERDAVEQRGKRARAQARAWAAIILLASLAQAIEAHHSATSRLTWQSHAVTLIASHCWVQAKSTRLARSMAAAPVGDFAIAEARELNRSALAELRALAATGLPGVTEAIEGAGLTLQPLAGSDAGSRLGSRAGSVRSSASGGSVASSGMRSGVSGRGAQPVQQRSFGFGI